MSETILLDEDSYEADHVKHSVGGFGGHIFRRAIHLSDPVMGEARRADKDSKIVFISGLIVVYLAWLFSWNIIGTPLLFALIIPPIQVASEWPRLRWIDDNGTMVLFPLLVVILLSFMVL